MIKLTKEQRFDKYQEEIKNYLSILSSTTTPRDRILAEGRTGSCLQKKGEGSEFYNKLEAETRDGLKESFVFNDYVQNILVRVC